ncbi:MAG: hypothetical protein Q4C71_00050 [Microbacteriaceae bacterium]|nr:hypothetical protein [Microbacteriaceae bacterium]
MSHPTSDTSAESKSRKTLLMILSMLIVLVLAANVILALIVANGQNSAAGEKRAPQWQDIAGEWRTQDGKTLNIDLSSQAYTPNNRVKGCFYITKPETDEGLHYCPVGETILDPDHYDDSQQRRVNASDTSRDRIWVTNTRTRAMEGPYYRTGTDQKVNKTSQPAPAPKAQHTPKWEDIEGEWANDKGKTEKTSLSDFKIKEQIGGCFIGSRTGGTGMIYYCPAGETSLNAYDDNAPEKNIDNSDVTRDRIWFTQTSWVSPPYYRTKDGKTTAQNNAQTTAPRPAPKWEDVQGKWYRDSFMLNGNYAVKAETVNMDFNDPKIKYSFNKMDGGCFNGGGVPRNPNEYGGFFVIYCPAGIKGPESLKSPSEDISRDRMWRGQSTGYAPYYRVN